MNLVAVLYPCLIVIPTHIPINKTFITILTYLWDEYIYIILSGILIKRDVCDEIFSIFDVKIEKFWLCFLFKGTLDYIRFKYKNNNIFYIIEKIKV